MRVRSMIGIDEVGRGALAGPLVLAAVIVPFRAAATFGDIPDSKRLSSRRRAAIAARFLGDPNVQSRIVSVSARRIDRVGMGIAAREGVARLLDAIPASDALVLLDGGLSAPARYRQLTIVRGDAQLPIIALASIIAKVARDRWMLQQHRRFPLYGFAIHKGYGTVAHYAALRRYGPSPIHRQSFRLS